MTENQNDLRERTTDFALRIVRMYTKLPNCYNGKETNW